MRGVHSIVDDIRRGVFKEVAKLAYEGGDMSRVDLIPYQMIPGDVAQHRYDVHLERAVIKARVRLALGMNIDRGGHLSTYIDEAVTDQKYFETPLVNVIHAACNACPPQGNPYFRQLPGLHFPSLHERVSQGCHLSGQA